MAREGLVEAEGRRGRPPTLFQAVRPQKPGAGELARCAAKLGVLPVVRARRRRLEATTIGVTGSVGKTTTKNAVAAVLSTLGPVRATIASLNRAVPLALMLLRAGHDDRFVVAELAATIGPDSLADLVWLLEPDVGIVTAIEHDHFAHADEAARAKVRLVRSLPRSGLAVLNADDPRVAAMASETAARTVFYGSSSRAAFRAEDVAARWPGRLRFTLVTEDGRRSVETRLVGPFWTTAALAALAAGITLGADPDNAIEALGEVEPEPHHLSVYRAPSGATFLQDEWKGWFHTFEPALDVLRAADARRKIAVIGHVGHEGRPADEVYADVVTLARERADLVVLVGPAAAYGHVSTAPGAPVVALDTVSQAGAFLREEAQPGDLVLVKSRLPGHLERVVLAQTAKIGCRRAFCEKTIHCENCRLLDPAAL